MFMFMTKKKKAMLREQLSIELENTRKKYERELRAAQYAKQYYQPASYLRLSENAENLKNQCAKLEARLKALK